MGSRPPGPEVLALATALALAGAAGCLPLPYASPPGRFSIGGGLQAPVKGRAVAPAGPFCLRGAAPPRQLQEDPHGRRVDIGFGYLLETTGQEDLPVHGPYLEIAGRLWGEEQPGDREVRLLAFVNADVLLDTSRAATRIGTGAAVGLLYELAFLHRGDVFSSVPGASAGGKDSDVIGVAVGESGVGGYVSAAGRWGPHEPHWLVTGGVSLRAPATFGALLVWLAGGG